MDIDACYHLGHVIKPHGLKGEVSILLDVDNPQNYKELESVFVEINKKLVPFFITSLRIKKNIAVVELEDINSPDDLKPLIGQDLYLPLEVLPPLEGDHFYYHEIIGFTIHDAQSGELGQVVSVYTNPSQDLIAMEYKNKEVLIPVSDEILKTVDRENQILYVDLPDGLLDIYLD